MKKYLMIIFILIFNMTFSQNDKVYKSATEFDFPPFSVPADGKADGFSVELLKAVADEVNIKIEFKTDYWENIINELRDGKVDLLPVVSRTEERDVFCDYSTPYLVVHANIYVRENNKSIKSENDLYGKEIIVMAGEDTQGYAEKRKFTDKLILTKTHKEAFKLLSSGKHDAIIAPNIVGMKLLDDLKIENIKTVTEMNVNGTKRINLNLSDYEQAFSFAVKKGDKKLLAKLNEGIAIVSINGKYQKIYEKWFPFLQDKTVMVRMILINLLLIFVPMIIIILIIAYVSVKKEVEERKKVERFILNAKEQAEKANKAKSEFLANMSHEIRTPLNGMVGFIDLLNDMETDVEKKGMLKNIIYSERLLMELINDILSLSKIEAGKIELEKEAINLKELENELCAIFKNTIKKGVELKNEIDETIKFNVLGDKLRIKQILINLLSNASKFTEKGEIIFKVERIETQKHDDSETIRFQIKDTGIGIKNENLEKIFEKFTQENMTIDKKYGGTGLGLAIVKGLVTLMNGKIEVESEVGVGSTFSVEINFKKAMEN